MEGNFDLYKWDSGSCSILETLFVSFSTQNEFTQETIMFTIHITIYDNSWTGVFLESKSFYPSSKSTNLG